MSAASRALKAKKRKAWCAQMRERILRHISIEPQSGCWLWTGRKNKGYGTITVRVSGYLTPRPLYVHRVAWEVFRERHFPRGKVAAHGHKCMAPSCCNPFHVRATTQSRNCLDKPKAKRWREQNLSEIFPPMHYPMARFDQ